MKLIFIFLLFFINLFPQDKLVFSSKYLPANDTVLIFQPEHGRVYTSLSIVILLHGWSGNYNQWNEINNLQQLSNDYACLIVCPDGLYDSWYVNSPINKKLRFESFLLRELIPNVIEKFGGDSNRIFISGLSMGGFGAIRFALKYPVKFKSAASTSGILDITMFPDKWGMEKVFGDFKKYEKNYRKNSPINLLHSYSPPLFIDCGTEDFAFEVNKNFYKNAIEKKIPVTFLEQPGNHSKEYWKKSLPKHFEFFKEHGL